MVTQLPKTGLRDLESAKTAEKSAGYFEVMLKVSQQAISKRLKQLGMILQNEGYLVPHELKLRDVERRLFACEQLRERQTRKGFLHRIDTGGDEKWVHHNNPSPNPSAENHEDCPVHANARPPHVAKLVVKKYLQTLKLKILPHPLLYSPDVAPSADFHLTHLAQWHTAWLPSTSARTKK
nr:Mariner Mos1 transposase [Hymenolepis microstoma]